MTLEEWKKISKTETLGLRARQDMRQIVHKGDRTKPIQNKYINKYISKQRLHAERKERKKEITRKQNMSTSLFGVKWCREKLTTIPQYSQVLNLTTE